MFAKRLGTARHTRRRGAGPLAAVAGLLLLSHAGAVAPAPGTIVTTAVTASYGLAAAGAEEAEETSASNAASFTVGRAGNVAVLPPAARQGREPGEDTCVFALQIQNTGPQADVFSAAVAAPDGWSAVLVQGGDGPTAETTPLALPLALDAGQSVRCFLRVTGPALSEQDAAASVRLVSQADPSQSAVFTGTVAAGQGQPGALRLGWCVQTGGPVRGEAALRGGVAYVGSDDGSLYAIAATPDAGAAPGTVLWRASTGSRMRGTPAVYAGKDGRVQVSAGSDGGSLTTWDAATGRKLWSCFVGPLGGLSWRARPLVSPDGGLVTVPSSRGLWSLETAHGLVRRRAPWFERTLAGNPTPTDGEGGAWLVGTSGSGVYVQNGLPTRRVRLGGPAAGGLLLDPVQNCLLGVAASGHVAAFDPASGLPDARRLLGGGLDLNVGVAASPALDAASGLLYVAAADHAVYAVRTGDGTAGGDGWPFAPRGAAGSTFRAAPLLWPSQDAGAPTLYVGDTGGTFYAVPTDRPDQASVFAPDTDGPALGAWDAAPAASGTGAQDVVVAGNSNGGVYGFLLQ